MVPQMQKFSVNPTKPVINSASNVNLYKSNFYNRNSDNSGSNMQYQNNYDINYNEILPNQEREDYEAKANEMLKGLTIGVNDPVSNRENTRILQSAMDLLSENGGGTLYMPAGEIYFGQGGTAGTNPNGEKFAIICRSNVNIKGAGTNGANATIFKPVRAFTPEEGSSMDMFFFNHYSTGNPQFAKAPDGSNYDYNAKVDYTYTNVEGDPITLKDDNFYLTNANFSNFIIDGSNVTGNKDGYTSAGKGFMINLFKDCNWNNVVVKDTDATGFGMDCPINCTITNCVAIGCGKQANETDGGASGFGIGTGYANNESIIISNCKSYNNTKYGIFFEHQSRFQNDDNTRYPATVSNGFIVTNCEAGGNLYDFGGIKAYDVELRNIKSVTANDTAQNSAAFVATPLSNIYPRYSSAVSSLYKLDRPLNSDYTKQHLYFSDYSVNCHVKNSSLYSNITDFGPYAPEISWALNSGAMALKSTTEFGSKDKLNRMDVMQVLFRYTGMPNEVDVTGRKYIGKDTFDKINKYNGNQNNFNDLSEYTEEGAGLEAIVWGLNNNIVSQTTNFNPNADCSRSQVITMLYRMAGSPKVNGSVPFDDIESNSWYSDALTWAYNNGIIRGVGANKFAPNSTISKEELAIMLSRYDNINNNQVTMV